MSCITNNYATMNWRRPQPVETKGLQIRKKDKLFLFTDMITYKEDLKKSNPTKKLSFDKSVKVIHSFLNDVLTELDNHKGGGAHMIYKSKLK